MKAEWVYTAVRAVSGTRYERWRCELAALTLLVLRVEGEGYQGYASGGFSPRRKRYDTLAEAKRAAIKAARRIVRETTKALDRLELDAKEASDAK